MLPTAVCTVVRVVLCSALLPRTLFGHVPLLRLPLPPSGSAPPPPAVCPAAQIRGPSCHEVLFIPCLLSPTSWVSRCFLAEGCRDQRAFPAAAPPDWLQEAADEVAWSLLLHRDEGLPCGAGAGARVGQGPTL